ncbi:hypothetical protein GGQ85_004433 [Nitrobacter vulgaris]|uniref:toll/interleukin-1 receptor domain-containing protein n=1 Tax=Nitrobacter vulgaris TaxID=29421 RepID=UPI002857CF0C|nr:toll/interleukin-1 receptor domain-containing protein [Nitrobacter vulgaris]MDR6306699.1 hypothetical protein [Nitrobacter vulgaris]
MPDKGPEKLLLFISHKHEHRSIADALRSFIETTTGGKVEVFQSSSEQAVGPRLGFLLNKELKTALWRAGAFVMIYTHPSLDWSYCMYEYGVANNPDSPDTRIILLQCCDAVPSLFHGQVNVNLRNLVDIQKFTNELLTTPNFFPGNGAITQHQSNGQIVAAAAADLFQKLQPLLPPPRPVTHEEWPAYPFLQLQLDLKHVEAIKNGPGVTRIDSNSPPNDRLRLIFEVIQKEAVVTGSDTYTQHLFASPAFEQGTNLETLAKICMDNEKSKSTPPWIESLCRQIAQAARWQFPPVIWELMHGVNDDAWYAPAVTRVRRLPGQHIQFDIYFFRFEVAPTRKGRKVSHGRLAAIERKPARGQRATRATLMKANTR